MPFSAEKTAEGQTLLETLAPGLFVLAISAVPIILVLLTSRNQKNQAHPDDLIERL